MPRRVPFTSLLKVSKSTKQEINNFRHGAYLTSTYGHSIDELLLKACVDRMNFGSKWLSIAKNAHKSRPPQNRLCITRAYYAMYHFARAVVFLEHGGDDHEAHSKLPGFLPDSFPNHLSWQNELKNARLRRNEADYDPYPKEDSAFSAAATDLVKKAQDFQRESKKYLRRKGVSI